MFLIAVVETTRTVPQQHSRAPEGDAKSAPVGIALARRAGEAIAGYEKVRLRLRGRTDAVVVIACDGADGSREKMKNFADGIPLIECLRAEELGAAFGREKTVHVALDDGGLAEKLQFEAQRLKGFRPYGRNGVTNDAEE